MTKIEVEGAVERKRIREELKASVIVIQANLDKELKVNEQKHRHDLALMDAKHKYDMEMLRLKAELQREGSQFNVEEIATVLEELEIHV